MPGKNPRTSKKPAVRTIRTDEVRYPGATLPPLPDDIRERYRAAMDAEGEQGLTAGLRDTGLAVEGRAARQQRARRRSQQSMLLVTAAVVVGFVLVGLGWRASSDKRALTSPLGGGASAAVASGSSSNPLSAIIAAGHSTPALIARSSAPATPGPTPYFASYKNLRLRLPVQAKSLTEIGFHQAAHPYALPMKTTMPDAKLSAAGNHKGTGRKKLTQLKSEDDVLLGKVLRMWRSRPGRPNTAADVGAKPGTAVYSPVTGTVVKIKKYLLYGRWPDYEIHIQADGYPNLDILVIHVTDVKCVVGDRVAAGETNLASVRKLSNKFYDQLASYTTDGGNHVHIQINDATNPKYVGLEGAVLPHTGTESTGGAASTLPSLSR